MSRHLTLQIRTGNEDSATLRLQSNGRTHSSHTSARDRRNRNEGKDVRGFKQQL
jgi:hypothetical protein